MFQQTWHGIDLTTLPAAAACFDRPASAEFYAQFYQALAAGKGRISPEWLESKRLLGECLDEALITPWKTRHGRTPRILALGAGKAPVEHVWHLRGHSVTFHDCQEDSLAETRRAYPQAGYLIGDIFQLEPKEKYDLISLITIDYVMNRAEFTAFLRRAAQWLAPDGQIIIYCASTLSFRQLAVETIKRGLGRYQRGRQVFWGYWRTPGEFFKTAGRAGLRVAEVYRLGEGLKPLSWFRRRPPLRSTHLVLTLENKH